MTTRLIRTLPVTTVFVASLVAPAAAATINGTGGPDELVGTAKADTIRGYAGNDVLRGRRGADHVYGGPGRDRMYSGPLEDARKDILYGGPGPDRIFVRGRDVVHAGRGDDTIVGLSSMNMWTVHVWCGPGYDRVEVNPWVLSGGGCEENPYVP